MLASSDGGDYFSFLANAGTATISADVIPAWGNYAVRAAAGAVLQEAAPQALPR